MSEDKLELQGEVIDKHPGAKFTVEVKLPNGESKNFMCTISGKLRMNNIKILVGDKVTINVSMYDVTKGIIVWRDK